MGGYGHDGLITSAAFIAPCALDDSLRWAVGGSEVVVDTVLMPPIVKYTANGGADDSDWSDNTGNLHTLLEALGWSTVDVHTIIPVLGGGGTRHDCTRTLAPRSRSAYAARYAECISARPAEIPGAIRQGAIAPGSRPVCVASYRNQVSKTGLVVISL